MSNDPFASPPPPGGGIDLKTVNGSLLLITVHALERDIQTKYGPSDAIRCNAVVLDGPLQDTQYEDTLIFPAVLRRQLGARMGQKVLGRLIQGMAKPGQDKPWILDTATEADKQVALAWMNQIASAPAAPF